MKTISQQAPSIAILLPCLNEEPTLAKVIRDFKKQIPQADVYVFDNGSTDRSVEIAKQERAHVIHVPQRGKGNVVRRMFEAVEADVYVMVDSDDTYDASRVWELINPVLNEGVDMTVGSRVAEAESAYRKFHRFGNALIINLINILFKSSFTDICSGYRAMSRNYVKNIPLLRDGFEVETELTVYSLINGFSVREVPLPYGSRPENSFSKLRTFSDGYKVVLTIVWLVRDTRPLLFFTLLSLVTFFGGALPLYLAEATGLFVPLVLSFLSIAVFSTGLVLNTINVKFSELQVLARRRNSTTERSDLLFELKQAA
ncbi:MAG: glycosyltransferase family 2 protein [Pseudomonadota bacterium]